MKGVGRMTRQMAMECTLIKMAHAMMESGLRISSMGRVISIKTVRCGDLAGWSKV